MFPADWDTATAEDKAKFARKLLNSPRGQLLIGHALRLTSEWTKAQDHPFRQVSDAEDMEVIATATDMLAMDRPRVHALLAERGLATCPTDATVNVV